MMQQPMPQHRFIVHNRESGPQKRTDRKRPTMDIQAVLPPLALYGIIVVNSDISSPTVTSMTMNLGRQGAASIDISGDANCPSQHKEQGRRRRQNEYDIDRAAGALCCSSIEEPDFSNLQNKETGKVASGSPPQRTAFNRFQTLTIRWPGATLSLLIARHRHARGAELDRLADEGHALRPAPRDALRLLQPHDAYPVPLVAAQHMVMGAILPHVEGDVPAASRSNTMIAPGATTNGPMLLPIRPTLWRAHRPSWRRNRSRPRAGRWRRTGRARARCPHYMRCPAP